MSAAFQTALDRFRALRQIELAARGDEMIDAAADATDVAYRALLACPTDGVAEAMEKVDAILQLHDGLVPIEGLVAAIGEWAGHTVADAKRLISALPAPPEPSDTSVWTFIEDAPRFPLLHRPFFGTPISIGEALLWLAAAPLIGAALTLAMAALP